MKLKECYWIFVFLLVLLFTLCSPHQSDTSTRNRYNDIIKQLGEKQDTLVIEQLQQLIDSDSTFNDAYVKLAHLYNKHNSPEEAIVYFHHLLEINPENPYAIYALGLIYQKQNDISRAIDCFKQSIQLSPQFPSPYKSLVMCYCNDKSSEEAQACLDTINKQYGETAALHYAQGYLYIQQQNWNEALKSLSLSFEMDNTNLDINNLRGIVCFNKSEFDEMLNYNQQGFELAKEQENLGFQCRFLGSIGVAYSRSDNLQQAIEYGERALAIAQQIGNQADITRNINNLGHENQDIGNYEQALHYFKQTLITARELNDKASEGLALRNIGNVYVFMGENEKAKEYFDLALPIVKETNDKNAKEWLFWSLGLLHENMGNYYISLDYYQQVLQMAIESGNRYGEGRYYNCIGNIHSQLGNYTKALDYFEQSIEIANEINDIKSWAFTIDNIGLVYNELGDQQKAIKYELQALHKFEELGLRYEICRILKNLGVHYQALEKYDEAENYYQQALLLNKEIGNRNEQVFILSNLGSLDCEQGKYHDAISKFNKALKIGKDIGNKRIILVQYVYLGEAYFSLGKYNTALKFYEKACKLANKLFVSRKLLEAHEGIARTELKRGNLEAAWEHYEQAIRQFENMRNFLNEDEFKTTFIQKNYNLFEQAIQVLAQLHKQFPHEKYDEQAFEIAEQVKSRALLDIINQGHAINTANDIPSEINDQLLITEKSIASTYAELSDVGNSDDHSPGNEKQSQLQNKLDALKRTRSIQLEKLRETSPDYYALTNPRTVSISEIQNNGLRDGQLVIEYLIATDQSYCWIISKHEVLLRIIPLSRSALQESLAKISPIFRQHATSQTTEMDHSWANINLQVLNTLYKQLIEQPVGSMLTTCTEISIVPDDILFYLPFEMLVSDNSGNKPRYFIESFPLSYSLSGSLMMLSPHRETKPNNDLLAFGNPALPKLDPDNKMLKRLSAVTMINPLFRNDQFVPLPESENEVKQIAQYFHHASVFTGKEASEDRFKKLSEDYRIIHLATHNITNDQEPMYSKILLARNSNSLEDGFLQTYEIYNLRLNAELVVLSGCSTGLGKLSRGEGLIGMTRAFFYAGAPSIVVSLWPVHDKSTADLMKEFYKHLNQGMSKKKALQKAKISLIQSSDWRQDPFYWGAFVLIGDGD